MQKNRLLYIYAEKNASLSNCWGVFLCLAWNVLQMPDVKVRDMTAEFQRRMTKHQVLSH